MNDAHLDKMIFNHGLDVDVEEGWTKLISRQFAGDAGRGFRELIQNFLDSYPVATPWEDRFAKIETGNESITIIDYGEGMDLPRLNLLRTLGGTDKAEIDGKIGKFGIGFFAVFSPALGTKEVLVTTRCEGRGVELRFEVLEPGKRPRIHTRVLPELPAYSTKVTLCFDNAAAVRRCLRHAREGLLYYPCPVLIDGERCPCVWDEAEQANARTFRGDDCRGFIRETGDRTWLRILCKYEYIAKSSMEGFAMGNEKRHWDLRDHAAGQIPWLPPRDVVLNIDSLRVTISRDSYYLDHNYKNALWHLRRALYDELQEYLEQHEDDTQTVLANQFIFRNELAIHLRLPDKEKKGRRRQRQTLHPVFARLAEAEVYRLNGRRGSYSLLELRQLHREDHPLFFSPGSKNLRWLGGAFKHDFIVLPSCCDVEGGAPGFYDELFGTVFDDIVNLDTIKQDNAKIAKLVQQGIVSKDALAPACNVFRERELSEDEKRLLGDLNAVLESRAVRAAIGRHLFIDPARIDAVFFEVNDDGVAAATGVFDQNGRPVSEEPTRLRRRAGQHQLPRDPVQIGLQRNHPFIRHLIESRDPKRAYYGLTFLAHELALCQKLLAPHSPFYHLVKERLSADMRHALLVELLGLKTAS